MSSKNYTIEWLSGKSTIRYLGWILGFLFFALVLTLSINYLAGLFFIKSLLTKINFLVPVLGIALGIFALTVLIQRPETGEIVLPFIRKPSAKREIEVKMIQRVLLGVCVGLLVLIHL